MNKANQILRFLGLYVDEPKVRLQPHISDIQKELPDYLKPSTEDQVQSLTRPNEELWEQLIRNIKLRSDTPGNIICEGYATHVPRVGYRITHSGRRYLKSKGC